MTTRRQRERQSRDRIARAVFAALERSGVSDRVRAEELTQRIFHRLEGMQPFPGMEGIMPRPVREPSPSEIEAIIQEVIMAQSKAQPQGATALLKPEIPGNGKEPEFPALTPNAIAVLEKRYLKKDSEGRIIETVDGMFRRVARNIAQAELRYDPQAPLSGAIEEEFYRFMRRLDFLPNSPTIMNAGRELQQLSACFVLPVEDSTEKIFDAVKHTALIHKSGGGTGFSFSRLRPEGDRVGSTGGIASGPVSFMRAFDTATEVIKQGGMRRGANMAILNVEHPDIEKFITAKADMVSLQNFNISVAVTEDFMRKVEKGEDYDLINPRTARPQGRRNAKEVFNKIVEMAWKNGDPGLVFLDRINAANPTPHLGAIESTNPCGEQPLLPYESCNLGSINLARMVAERGGVRVVDWESLEKTVRLAVHFLDNVIDMNQYPLPPIAEMTRANRKVGLGVMGFADLLILLDIPYDSELALETAAKVMKFISEKADAASAELAQVRGAFPAFKGSIYDKPGAPLMRNATRTTIAPTGTLSIIAGCSSGIEPLYALSFVRNILDKAQLVEVNPYFEGVARREGFWSETLMQELAKQGCVRGMKGVPEGVQRLFVTAHDIAPEWHVRMQAAFQRHTDNAVSKTVNFPQSATVEDVARVYIMAYQEGCKGITIYRDQSREQQVLVTRKPEVPPSAGEEKKDEPRGKRQPRPRPAETRGVTRKVATGCGSLYVTVNTDEEGLAEVFTSLGKAGGCASAQLEATSRLISLALRSGVDVEAIVKQLKGIRCPSIAWEEGHATLSCADAIASVLERYLEGQEEGKATSAAMPKANPAPALATLEPPRNLAGQCPECSSLLIYQEGCYVCHFCGYTKCS